MSNFLYIEHQDKVDLALTQLAQSPYLAIDTESSGYYTYFSELCLVQISAGGKHYIMDPLANLQLDGLGKLCEEPGITKVFHSAASDIAELKRTYNWKFSNVFDTFIASRFLGHANCSLSSLVSEYEGIDLEKKEQKSNWKKRPLTHSQLEYAHLDTVYLESIMLKLKAKLEDYGMYTEVSEEFARVCQIEVEPLKKVNPNGWKQLPNVKQLTMEQQSMLRALYLLRDKRARDENIAAFRLLSNSVLIRLVKERPDNLDKTRFRKNFHPAFFKGDAKAVLEILKGKNINPILVEKEKQKPKKLEQGNKNILKALKRWRNGIAEYRGIDSSMVISGRYLDIIAQKLPQDEEALEKLGLLTKWKSKTYGPQILDIIHGKYDGGIPKDLIQLSSMQEGRGLR